MKIENEEESFENDEDSNSQINDNEICNNKILVENFYNQIFDKNKKVNFDKNISNNSSNFEFNPHSSRNSSNNQIKNQINYINLNNTPNRNIKESKISNKLSTFDSAINDKFIRRLSKDEIENLKFLELNLTNNMKENEFLLNKSILTNMSSHSKIELTNRRKSFNCVNHSNVLDQEVLKFSQKKLLNIPRRSLLITDTGRNNNYFDIFNSIPDENDEIMSEDVNENLNDSDLVEINNNKNNSFNKFHNNINSNSSYHSVDSNQFQNGNGLNNYNNFSNQAFKNDKNNLTQCSFNLNYPHNIYGNLNNSFNNCHNSDFYKINPINYPISSKSYINNYQISNPNNIIYNLKNKNINLNYKNNLNQNYDNFNFINNNNNSCFNNLNYHQNPRIENSNNIFNSYTNTQNLPINNYSINKDFPVKNIIIPNTPTNVDDKFIYDNFFEYLKSQKGCRLIQIKIEEKNYDFIMNFYEKVIKSNKIVQIINEQFGNYVIQKFMEITFKDKNIITTFFEKISQDIFEISINKYGTIVLQKILDLLNNNYSLIENNTINNVLRNLIINNTMNLSSDTNGNHVLMKIILIYPRDNNQFIFDVLSKYSLEISKLRQGVYIFERAFEVANEKQRVKNIFLNFRIISWKRFLKI